MMKLFALIVLYCHGFDTSPFEIKTEAEVCPHFKCYEETVSDLE